ncbi:RICIN domain-containing protein [Kitasatospora sp. NPDC101235]|uniref:RICIN domain-containing protein n=1 Tax=Kitasatospora sp. NPDC101235 TaxID=3364101 RepID=UPI0037FF10AA
MKSIRRILTAAGVSVSVLAGVFAVDVPAQAAVPRGWVHVQNVGTGQYLDDYANNTSQGAPVYAYPQTGQNNQWWYVTMTSTNNVVFSSYQTRSCDNLFCTDTKYRNLRRSFGNTGELSEYNQWYDPYDNTGTRSRWWYAAGDAGTYIHSADGDQGCLTAHAWSQVTIEDCRTGDHNQQWSVIYS